MAADPNFLAILSADAVGYSRLMAEDAEGTAQAIAASRSLISDVVARTPFSP